MPSADRAARRADWPPSRAAVGRGRRGAGSAVRVVSRPMSSRRRRVSGAAGGSAAGPADRRAAVERVGPDPRPATQLGQPSGRTRRGPPSACSTARPSATSRAGHAAARQLPVHDPTVPRRPQPAAARNREQRRGSGALVAGVAVLALLVGGGAGALGGYLVADVERRQRAGVQRARPEAKPAEQTSSAPAGSVEAVAEKVSPSVVQLQVQGRSSAGEGSGFIISSDGLILTNNHVVEAAAEQRADHRRVRRTAATATATIVGRDPTSDVAVVKAEGKSGLPVVELGSSDDAQGRPGRGGDRLAVRAVRHRHLRHRQLAAPADPRGRRGRLAGDRDGRDPDRRGDQPGQLRWPAGQHAAARSSASTRPSTRRSPAERARAARSASASPSRSTRRGARPTRSSRPARPRRPCSA